MQAAGSNSFSHFATLEMSTCQQLGDHMMSDQLG
jgi:hypothetical protein